VRNILGMGMGPHGQIIQEIRSSSRAFELCEFVHEGRSSNIDAHNLARSTLSLILGGMFGF
jgi:hypothetical protein